MKTTSSSRYGTLLLALGLCFAAYADPGLEHLVEKKKKITKVYTVGMDERLSVDNQYGQVKVNLWERRQIQVVVTITANAPTGERAEDYLDATTISEDRQGNSIVLRTEIDRSHFSSHHWSAWRSKPGEKNSIQIDYVINMPKYNDLIVRNKFGNTDIPSFEASLQVHSRNGHFSANDLEGVRNTIEVLYGTARIGRMDGGRMQVKYSDLNLDKARSLVLDYKGGKLNIGQVDRLEAEIDYSGLARIGSVGESCKVKVSYSGDFSVSRLPASAANVDIRASYSSVALPAESSQFDVTVTNGNLSLPSGVQVRFTDQPAKTDTYRSTKQYTGSLGKGSGAVIRVVSHYGDVKFRD